MGAAQCKCCSDADADAVPVPLQAASAFSEDVEKRKPTVANERAQKAFDVEQRPPEQAGSEPNMSALKAPAPASPGRSKEEKQTESRSNKKEAAGKGDGLRTLQFELEAKQNFGVRFAELSEPEPQGTLVATSIADRSALSVATNGLRGILAGDVIAQVNGEGGSRARLLALLTQAKSKGGTVEITVRPRPPTFELELLRTGEEKMGIVVAVHDDIPDRVEVRQVSDDGAVPTWNEKNPMNQVVSGDWLMTVNGESKAANDMISDMQSTWGKREKLKMQILSYPTEEMRQKPASPRK